MIELFLYYIQKEKEYIGTSSSISEFDFQNQVGRKYKNRISFTFLGTELMLKAD